MKNLIRIAAIAGSLALAMASFAQDKPMAAAANTPEQGAVQPLDIDRMNKELKLTPDQLARLKALNEQTMRHEAGLSQTDPEQHAARERELSTLRDKEMGTVLTTEQAKQWSQVQRASERDRLTKANPSSVPAKPAGKSGK